MKSLEMMYVYFDVNGDIKSISPDLNSQPEKYNVCTFPLSDVEDFLRGKKNPFNFTVKVETSIAGVIHRIARKHTIQVSQIRTLDSFLTEITPLPVDKSTYILIENMLYNKTIRVSLNSGVSVALKESEDQDLLDLFFAHNEVYLFFTKKCDPSFLVHSIIFSPKELLNKDQLQFRYDVDLSNTSLYTKRIINNYSYIIRQDY